VFADSRQGARLLRHGKVVTVLVVFNKGDIAKEGQIEEARKVFGKDTVLEGQGLASGLKEEIASKIGIKK
jgi:hypothetical protein